MSLAPAPMLALESPVHPLGELVFSCFVPGKAAPGGSKTASVARTRTGAIILANGRPILRYRDAGKHNAEWKSIVAVHAKAACSPELRRQVLDQPLAVVFTFHAQRPQAHYRGQSAELRPDAPLYPTAKPDVTKLVRAIEDALTGIVWADDALISLQSASKVWAEGRGLAAKVGAMVQVYVRPECQQPASTFGPECSSKAHR